MCVCVCVYVYVHVCVCACACACVHACVCCIYLRTRPARKHYVAAHSPGSGYSVPMHRGTCTITLCRMQHLPVHTVFVSLLKCCKCTGPFNFKFLYGNSFVLVSLPCSVGRVPLNVEPLNVEPVQRGSEL